ncbi:MAG: sigma-70 family RNA polymerase sigma factor [Pirellulales bacterium]|nr:sigma-70 family RNA polymerase sigma factor [Pirellulales bacterium]
MNDNHQSEEFVKELTGCQDALFAFILSLVQLEDAARDVLQNTNVVLWRKAGDYQPGTRFLSWAFTVARLEVRTYYKKAARDRLIFDDALLDKLVSEAEQRSSESELSIRAFEHCVKQLTGNQREMLTERYSPGSSVAAMAEKRKQSPAAISVSLSRIRRTLRECISRRLSRGESS